MDQRGIYCILRHNSDLWVISSLPLPYQALVAECTLFLLTYRKCFLCNLISLLHHLPQDPLHDFLLWPPSWVSPSSPEWHSFHTSGFNHNFCRSFLYKWGCSISQGKKRRKTCSLNPLPCLETQWDPFNCLDGPVCPRHRWHVLPDLFAPALNVRV